MSDTHIKYIKCFDCASLVTFLENESFHAEAKIIKSLQINGLNFLEISEKSLLSYSLSASDRKRILKCHNQVLSPEINNAIKLPPPKPPPRQAVQYSNKLGFSSELQKKLNDIQKNKAISNDQVDGKIKSNDDNRYVDMTEKPKQLLKAPNTSQIVNKATIHHEYNKKLNDLEEKERYYLTPTGSAAPEEKLLNTSTLQKPTSSGLLENNRYDQLYVTPETDVYEEEEVENPSYVEIPTAPETINDLNTGLSLPTSTKSGTPLPQIAKRPGKLPRPPNLNNDAEKTLNNAVKELLDISRDVEPSISPYYRDTDRLGAIQLLKRTLHLDDGVFFIRNSKKYFLALTIYHNESFYSVGIHRNPDGSFYCKTNDKSKIICIPTLKGFVEYYKTHPLGIVIGSKTVKIYLKDPAV